jgi:hypothetical protein
MSLKLSARSLISSLVAGGTLAEKSPSATLRAALDRARTGDESRWEKKADTSRDAR